MGIEFESIYKEIKELCLKTLICVEPAIRKTNQATKFKCQCFEIYGFDILIDSNLKPWLIEVNCTPSFSSSSPFDKEIKSMLLSDSLHLIGFNIFDRKQIRQVRKLEIIKGQHFGKESDEEAPDSDQKDASEVD